MTASPPAHQACSSAVPEECGNVGPDGDTQKLKLVESQAYANGLQKNIFDVLR